MKYDKVSLKELIIIKNGKDHKTLKDGKYPVYGSGGIIRYAEKYLYNKESVLLPRKGTLNNIQYADKPFWTVDTCYYTEVNTDKVIPYFLFRNLRQFDIEVLNTGSAIPSMTFDKYYSIQVALPNLEKQQKIVDILKPYDNLIENSQKQIELLEEAAQRLYKEWFVDLHFPGNESISIIDGIPEEWNYKLVSDFGKVITGKTPSTSKREYYNGNIPFVTIPDMHEKVFPLVTEKTLTKLGADSQKNKYLPKNAVIVSCIATVGLVNIAVEPCQTNQQINSIVLYDDNNLYFFYESMKRIKSLLDGVGSSGATMTNVSKTKFSNIKVLYPTEDLVYKYNQFCKPIFDKILVLSKSILLLEQMRDRLLPKLMSGEIEV